MTYVGIVTSFDEAVGLLEASVPAGSGGGPGRFGFHCTQIADGSRTIEVGTKVTFALVAGRLGRWEAAEVTPAQ